MKRFYGGNMRRFTVKCRPDKLEYMDVLSETENGYNIRLTSIVDGDERVREEFMYSHLFEMCLTTGYISELPVEELSCSASAA